MKISDAFRNAKNSFAATLEGRYQDNAIRGIRGDVFMELRNARTGALEEKREKKNVVVRDAPVLLARLLKDSHEPPKGAFVLAVGSGDVGWDVMNPPPATDTQRALYAEISRKTFSSTYFVGPGGTPVGYPTNVVDFQTIFSESEAVGPLVEMGILGGNIDANLSIRNPVSPPNGAYDATVNLTTAETMINFLSFSVINKPATSTFSIIWRLSF